MASNLTNWPPGVHERELRVIHPKLILASVNNCSGTACVPLFVTFVARYPHFLREGCCTGDDATSNHRRIGNFKLAG
jgi:hypothetical protein